MSSPLFSNASDLFDMAATLTPAPTTNWASLLDRTPSPLSTSDAFDDTFDSVAKIVIIVPIVAGVVVFFCISICVCCYCRSQRIKRENAETVARAQDQHQQAQLQGLSLAPPHHVLIVSPNAPTYNSSLFSSGSSANEPYAVRMPSAPSASTADRVYLANLQQQQHNYYAHQSPAPAVPPRSPVQPPQPAAAPPVALQSDQPQPWDDPVITASRIPLDAVYTHTLVSKGGFGEVFKGSYRDRTVAIKQLLPDTRRDLKQIAAFFTEIKMMAAMEHERIVQYIGVAWDALSDVRAVTEFMEGGDLRAALAHFDEAEQRPPGFDKQKVTLAWHVAHALAFMHSFRPVVLHRDLKSRNILLDETLSSAKLSDFGVSRERSDRTMTAAVGTVLWMAPEVMTSGKYDEKADVFSFGVVLSELDTHQMPYTQVKERMVSESGRPLPDTALLQRIMMGTVSVSFSANILPEIRELGEACVNVNPDKRPTTSEVLYALHKLVRAL